MRRSAIRLQDKEEQVFGNGSSRHKITLSQLSHHILSAVQVTWLLERLNVLSGTVRTTIAVNANKLNHLQE